MANAVVREHPTVDYPNARRLDGEPVPFIDQVWTHQQFRIRQLDACLRAFGRLVKASCLIDSEIEPG